MLNKCSGRVKTYFEATNFNLSESKNESRRLGTHKLLTNKQSKRLPSILTANGAAVEYVLPCLTDQKNRISLVFRINSGCKAVIIM
jgi:hypothetical protein